MNVHVTRGRAARTAEHDTTQRGAVRCGVAWRGLVCTYTGTRKYWRKDREKETGESGREEGTSKRLFIPVIPSSRPERRRTSARFDYSACTPVRDVVDDVDEESFDVAR